MLLTPWEEERLLIFSAAELARRHRAAGLQLNAPEAVALMCDAMLEAARAGASYAEVEDAGRGAVAPDEVMPGVRELASEVRLEVLLQDGTRLIVLVDPLGGLGTTAEGAGTTAEGAGTTAEGLGTTANGPGTTAEGLATTAEGAGTTAEGPGAVQSAATPGAEPTADLERLTLRVENTSQRAVRVSSHFPFDRTNPRLSFDRAAARGFRLDLPAGSSERWAPGEARSVTLVRYRGTTGRSGTSR